MLADSDPADAYLSVTVQRDSGRTWVIAAGEIDMSTADRFQDQLNVALDAHPTVLVVDLGDVTVMDSSGITTLLHARNRAIDNGATLTVINLQPFVRRVLAVIGVLPILTGDD